MEDLLYCVFIIAPKNKCIMLSVKQRTNVKIKHALLTLLVKAFSLQNTLPSYYNAFILIFSNLWISFMTVVEKRKLSKIPKNWMTATVSFTFCKTSTYDYK